MKVDDKSPKRPLIFYYLIAMVVLMLLNALVFPAMLATPVTEVGYNDFSDHDRQQAGQGSGHGGGPDPLYGHRRKRPDRHLQDGPLAG